MWKITIAALCLLLMLSIRLYARPIGTFYEYIKTFTGEEVIFEVDRTTNELSDRISEDLKKRGMKFTGSTIIYSYLQAIGVIHSHEKDCFLFKGAIRR